MKKCKNCMSLFPDEYRYCTMCGTPAPDYSTVGGVFLGILKGCLYVALYFAIQIIVTTVCSFAIGISSVMSGTVSAEDVVNAAYKQLDVISITSALLFFVILFVIFTVRKKELTREIGLKKCNPFGLIILALVLGFALNFVSDIATRLIPFPQSIISKYEEIYKFLGAGNPVIEFIDVAIIAPIAEEVVFRGLCYSRIRRVVPAGVAALISALIFAVSHGNVISFTFTFPVGVILAVLFEESGSLLVPAVMHVGFNSASFIAGTVIEKNNTVPYVAAILLVALAVSVITFYFAIVTARKKRENNAQNIIPPEAFGQ